MLRSQNHKHGFQQENCHHNHLFMILAASRRHRTKQSDDDEDDEHHHAAAGCDTWLWRCSSVISWHTCVLHFHFLSLSAFIFSPSSPIFFLFPSPVFTFTFPPGILPSISCNHCHLLHFHFGQDCQLNHHWLRCRVSFPTLMTSTEITSFLFSECWITSQIQSIFGCDSIS